MDKTMRIFTERDIDLAYITGVFNVVGIDGLSKELKRLKSIGKRPVNLFDSVIDVPYDLSGSGLMTLRKELKYTLRDVSDLTGIPFSTISRIENGKPHEYDAHIKLIFFYKNILTTK